MYLEFLQNLCNDIHFQGFKKYKTKNLVTHELYPKHRTLPASSYEIMSANMAKGHRVLPPSDHNTSPRNHRESFGRAYVGAPWALVDTAVPRKRPKILDQRPLGPRNCVFECLATEKKSFCDVTA